MEMQPKPEKRDLLKFIKFALVCVGIVIITSVCIATFGNCWDVKATDGHGFLFNKCTGQTYFIDWDGKELLKESR